MKHEPFTTWLISEDPLEPEEDQELRVHLKNCEDCRQLQAASLRVDDLFQRTSPVRPFPGFVNRFQKRLEVELLEEKYIRHRWQSLIFFILTVNVIAFVLLVLGVSFYTTYSSPAEFILAYINQLTSLISFLNTAQNIALIMINSLISLVPPSVWMLIMSIIGLSSLFLIIATQHFSGQPRRA